jgi:ABC-type Mn2+/Zn2+ transport system permease subunit
MAAASRVPVGLFQVALLEVIGFTVVVALQVMGIVLVLAMMVAPAATAELLTRRLHPMMAVAESTGAACSIVGLYVAWYADVATSATIVLMATGLFIAAFLFGERPLRRRAGSQG